MASASDGLGSVARALDSAPRHAWSGLLPLIVGGLLIPWRRLFRALLPPRLLAGISGALLLVVSTQAAPHLVHHVFDPDHGASCAVLQFVGHHDGIGVEREALDASLPMVSALPPVSLFSFECHRPLHRGRDPPA